MNNYKDPIFGLSRLKSFCASFFGFKEYLSFQSSEQAIQGKISIGWIALLNKN